MPVIVRDRVTNQSSKLGSYIELDRFASLAMTPMMTFCETINFKKLNLMLMPW